MKPTLLVCLLLTACGAPPEKVCIDCDRLSEALALAEAMLAESVGADAARAAFDVRVKVAPVECLAATEEGACQKGEFHPDRGLLVTDDLLMLLHEGVHSHQWNAERVMGHDWPQEWRELDREFRVAVCPGFECP